MQVLNIQQGCQRLTIEQKMYFDDFWDEHKSSELEGRNQIVRSFCPQVYGLYQIKLAVCIILCGGVEVKDPSGTKIRGESHILLVRISYLFICPLDCPLPEDGNWCGGLILIYLAKFLIQNFLSNT